MQTTKQSLQLEYQDGDVLLSDNIIVGRKYLYHRILYEFKTVLGLFWLFLFTFQRQTVVESPELVGDKYQVRGLAVSF